MQCFITALTRPANRKIKRKKNKQQSEQTQKSHVKTQYLNLKASSNVIRMDT